MKRPLIVILGFCMICFGYLAFFGMAACVVFKLNMENYGPMITLLGVLIAGCWHMLKALLAYVEKHKCDEIMSPIIGDKEAPAAVQSSAEKCGSNSAGINSGLPGKTIQQSKKRETKRNRALRPGNC